ncbi:hypothetical protein ACFXTN_027726 [Malus domestica]
MLYALRFPTKSSAKEIAFDQHFQHALQGGIDKLARDTSAKAVKLILYFQYKDGKRMGAFYGAASSYASSLALKVEPSTTLLLSTKEVLVQKLSSQAVLAQLNSHLPSKNNKFTLRLQGSSIEFHCKQFQISIANPNLEDKVVFQGKGNVMNLGFSDWLNHY